MALFLFFRTVEGWEKSFIAKRVMFEAFDCYLALFYIAFYRFDVVALRNELIGLFSGMVAFLLIHLPVVSRSCLLGCFISLLNSYLGSGMLEFVELRRGNSNRD